MTVVRRLLLLLLYLTSLLLLMELKVVKLLLLLLTLERELLLELLLVLALLRSRDRHESLGGVLLGDVIVLGSLQRRERERFSRGRARGSARLAEARLTGG